MTNLAKRLVDDFFSRVWSPPNDLDAIDELMTEDYEITTAGKLIRGREAFKAWVGEFQEKLLEPTNKSFDIFSDSEGEKVVSRWTCTGKNNGLMGTKPDLRLITFTGIAIWHIRDGRLAKCWVERSALELYNRIHKEQSTKGTSS